MVNQNETESFIDFLEKWQGNLPEISISGLTLQPERVALISVDMIQGFCAAGPLFSPKIAAILPRITTLFTNAWDAGVRQLLLIQDNHAPDALEFSAFPPHCVRGTVEADAPDEFKQLPFYSKMLTISKNSIASEINSHLGAWMAKHPEVDIFIVTGSCTDICIRELVTFLRAEADAYQLSRRVIVPENCVSTYDRPLSVARQQGGLPHPADILHNISLYQMALLGIEVVKNIK